MSIQTCLSDDEAQIHATIAAWTAALGAKDAAAVISHHAPDFVLFSLAPPLVAVPSDPVELQDWFDSWSGPIELDYRSLGFAAGGDVACSWGLIRMQGTKTDGTAVDLWFRGTLVLRRTDGGWKIVHEHESVPFYMDGSFGAAIDLAP
jgi:PhnB protein